MLKRTAGTVEGVADGEEREQDQQLKRLKRGELAVGVLLVAQVLCAETKALHDVAHRENRDTVAQL